MGISKQSGIKSIQRVALTIANASTSGTAAISAVNTAKTELTMLGCIGNTDVVVDNLIRLWLNSATEVGALRNGISQTASVTVQVTEYY